MLDDFLVRTGLGGLGVALAAAPLGCFVVWRRMAYFGEATAHGAMLGVALSLAFEQSIFYRSAHRCGTHGLDGIIIFSKKLCNRHYSGSLCPFCLGLGIGSCVIYFRRQN